MNLMFKEVMSRCGGLFKHSAFIGICTCAILGSWAATDPFAGYSHKARIAFSGYEGTTTLTNFPALVRLTEGVGGFSYNSCQQANGGDVRFTRGDGVELASSCASWNTSGTSEFWVRIPELTNDTVIYMVYGNADSPARDQRLQVWDEHYSAVWNMDNAGLAVIDASGNSNHGSAKMASCATGIVGNSHSFVSADSDYARAGRGYDDSFSTPSYAYEGWFKTSALPSDTTSLFGYMSHRGSYADACMLRELQLTSGGKINVRYGKGSAMTSTAALEANAWHYVALSCDSVAGTIRLFVDGVQCVQKTVSGEEYAYLPEIRFQFANADYIGQKKYFNGSLDEVRISKTSRPSDYFSAVYANLMTAGNFYDISDWTDEVMPSVDPIPTQYCAITVSAEEGGTVSPSGTIMVERGKSLRISASYPTSDRAFYAWGGDCPTTSVFSAEITIPADRDRTLLARFGKNYVILPEDGRDTIKEGLDQIAADAASDPSVLPAVLSLGAGTYYLTNAYVKAGYAYEISSAIAVRSSDGTGKAILDFSQLIKKSIVYGRSAFKLDSMGAVLDGLTFTHAAEHSAYSDNAVIAQITRGHLLNCTVDGYSERSDSDRCVTLSAGWVSRCRFLNATAIQNGTRSAPLNIAAGTLFDSCIVSNFCGSYTEMYLSGTVRNCLFASCSTSYASRGYGGALKASDSIALVENCTFIDCEADYGGALAYTGDGLLPIAVNCAFVGNSAANDAQGNDVWNVALACSASQYASAGVDGNIKATPVFESGTYSPAANSPTRNAAAYARWAFAPAMMDVRGTNRVEESALDIGCSEFPEPASEPLKVNVTADVYAGRDTLTVQFSSSVTGDKAGISYDWDFGDGSPHETSASPSHAYTSCGYYTVKLVVSNAAEETDTFSKPSFIQVLPSKCYVRAAGESTPTDPYCTPETAADRLYDVMSIAPSEVDVGEGDIEIGDFCDVTQPVVIRGKGPSKTILKSDGISSSRMDSAARLIYLKHSNAVLADITLKRAVSCNWGVPIGMTAGLLTNCVVRDVFSQSFSAVDMSGGSLIGCQFIGNGNSYDGSGAVAVSGAGIKIINCIFDANYCGWDKNGSYGAAVRISENYSLVPVIRNCLFARNYVLNVAGRGVVFAKGGLTIDNCTFVQNGYDNDEHGGGGLYVTSDATVGSVACRNCIFYENMRGGVVEDVTAAAGHEPVLTTCSVGVDPQFYMGKPSSRPYYAIRGSSPCRDAGTQLDWMNDGAVDLIGGSRVFGGKPDMGCYEGEFLGFMMFVR